MANKYDSQANVTCRGASSTGTITRTAVNMLARTFALMGEGAQLAVRAIDKGIVQGTIKVVEDGSSVFKHPDRRR